jgi:hypothetical protein
MACNGHNHPNDCTCDFRGGHTGSRPPIWRGWCARAVRRYIDGPNAVCPECHAPTYFVPGPRGGGAYFDCFGPPWTKHPCTDKQKVYSPYNAAGNPKLRNRRSEFERSGWTPLFIRNIEALTAGTIVHGVALNNPTVLHFGFVVAVDIDRARPIFFRTIEGREPRIELNFFHIGSVEPYTARAFEDCRNEIELLLKRPA